MSDAGDSLSVSLREHLERRLVDHEEIHRREARALETANAELIRRLEAMNEIREQLDRQANTFATKAELDAVSERGRTHITRGELAGVLGVFGAITMAVLQILGM